MLINYHSLSPVRHSGTRHFGISYSGIGHSGKHPLTGKNYVDCIITEMVCVHTYKHTCDYVYTCWVQGVFNIDKEKGLMI